VGKDTSNYPAKWRRVRRSDAMLSWALLLEQDGAAAIQHSCVYADQRVAMYMPWMSWERQDHLGATDAAKPVWQGLWM